MKSCALIEVCFNEKIATVLMNNICVFFNSSSAQFLSLRLTSITTGETLWRKTFKSMINDVHTNSKLLLITFYQKIAAFDLQTLEQAFTITG